MAQIDESPPIALTRADEERGLRTIALRRIKKRRDFLGHLVVYLAVNAFFWIVWIVDGVANGFEAPWPLLPTFFWGLFVLFQGIEAYRPRHISEAQLEREMQQLRTKRPGLEEYELHEDDWPFDEE